MLEGGITPLHPRRGKGKKEGGVVGMDDAQHVGIEEKEDEEEEESGEEHQRGKRRE